MGPRDDKDDYVVRRKDEARENKVHVPHPTEGLMSFSEASDQYGYHEDVLRKAARRGILRTQLHQGELKVTEDDVYEWADYLSLAREQAFPDSDVDEVFDVIASLIEVDAAGKE